MIEYKIERNPILTHTYKDGTGKEVSTTILCLGDPHFGRRFTTGVPKHRLGERERGILAEFKRLLSCNVDYIVIMGDLFDKFIVTPTIVSTVYSSLLEITDTPIYIIPGNHDLSKDNTKTSSFALFTLLTNSTLKNVKVIEDVSLFNINCNLDILLDVYDPFSKESLVPNSIIEKITEKRSNNPEYELITFGHWDSMDLTENGWMPSKQLLSISDLVVSGHEHSYREYKYPFDTTKTTILFSGSLQPYSHAEDPDKELYITLDKSELSSYNLQQDFKYKCVRVICDSYFVFDEPIDCYSLTCKIVLPEEVDSSFDKDDKLDLENYSTSMQTWSLSEESLTEEYKQELKTILEEKPYL